MSRTAFSVLWILLCAKSVWCVRITEFDIPGNVRVGDTIILTCKYDLQGDTLYSVKWYKDDLEFYRFTPNDKPQKKSYPLDGINVDLQNSVDTMVTLEEVDEETSGEIKCEVAAAAPYYQTSAVGKYLCVKDRFKIPNAVSSSQRIYGLLTFAVLLGMFILWYPTSCLAN